MVNQKITEKQAEYIGKLYIEGHSTVILARSFNVSHHTIRRWLRKQNIVVRNSQEAGKLASLEGRLFGQHILSNSSKILTREKAYILGVMCGDGYLHKAKHSYQIGLQATDKDFVKKFHKNISDCYDINPSFTKILSRKHNWKDKWQSRLCSKAVYNDILSYGSFRSYNWSIPDIILNGPNKIKAEFFWLYKIQLDSCHLPLSSQGIRCNKIYFWPIKCCFALSFIGFYISFFNNIS